MGDRDRRVRDAADTARGAEDVRRPVAPGRVTLTARIASGPVDGTGTTAGIGYLVRGEPVQRRQRDDGIAADSPWNLHETAAAGVAGPGQPLPHGDAIQRAFGRHDVSGVRAHMGAAAAAAAVELGAEAYTTGRDVAFAGSPSLYVAAHEAAHVVQQRAGVQLAGGAGQAGDLHEQHADAVAERVVAGESAEALLDQHGGTGGGDARSVQRYSVEHGYRVSGKRALAIEDKAQEKKYFATATAVARSNALLEGMKSPVKLVQGDAAPEVLPNMRTVTPANRDDQKPLFDVNECIDVADRVTGSGQTHAVYQPRGGGKRVQRQSAYELASLNKLIEVLSTTPDVTPQDVIGGQRKLEANDDAPALKFALGQVKVSTDSPATASQAIKGQVPNRNLRVALLLNTLRDQFEQMPEVQQEIVDRVVDLLSVIEVRATEDKDEDEIESWARIIEGVIRDMRAEKSGTYANMDERERGERAGRLGVNEHARPEVGESYGIMSTRERTERDGEKWSFHFAAVIARDEDDSVTLENYNRQVGARGNEQWYFDMQGPLDQSFHTRHEDSVADGVTLRMGQAATPELKQEFLQRIAAKLGGQVPLAFQMRIQVATTRAELAAIYADALGT